MAGYLTPVAKANLLNYLSDAFSDNGTLYFGLAQGLGLLNPPTLTTIAEVDTPYYARAQVSWTSATADNPLLNNSQPITIGPVSEDMPPASYGFLTNAAPIGNGSDPATNPTSVDAPSGLTVGSPVDGGGSVPSGQYYYVVTALTPAGETTASNEVSVALGANQTALLTWNEPSNPPLSGYTVTGYNVYRGTFSGGENLLVGTANPGSPQFTDNQPGAAAGTSQTPPLISSAVVGDIFYVWELAEPVSALAGSPIYVPTNGLVIE